jgi:hypothetical protein
VLRKDGKPYVVTNPIFLEDEPAFKYAYENSMPTESVQDKSVRDESAVEKGAEKGAGRGVKGKVNGEVEGEEERNVGETRSHDLVEPIAEPASVPIRKSP